MSYRLDYDEGLRDVVQRLQEEHREIDKKLDQISKIVKRENGNLRVALSLLNSQKTTILRHSIEEESRLMRAIMKSNETRKESLSSLKILQEHRRIKEFFEDELPYLLYENCENQVTKRIIEFIELIHKHQEEEERETFPLALEAILSSSRGR